MRLKQTILLGDRSKLRDFLEANGSKPILLVTGSASYKSSGAADVIEEILKGIEFHRFSDFDLNPKAEDINQGARLATELECGLVLGIGGGSAIDVAKAVAFLANQEGNIIEYLEGRVPQAQVLPIVAVPTTAGTGSEATHFSVVYHGRRKYSLAYLDMLPLAAYLDPTLTHSLPPRETACSGFDALCQAIESFWSTRSTVESRSYSLEAISTILPNIAKAVNDPDDKARTAMLHGSNLAGRAINIAQTTAAHAVSYPMTSYFGVPHGHAVALTLPHFIVFNAAVDKISLQDKRGVEYVRQTIAEICSALGVERADLARDRLIHLMKEVGLETALDKAGVKSLDTVADNGFNPQRMANNPRFVSKEGLRDMLRSIY